MRSYFDSATVEPSRQFDLFYETVNSQVIRITPEKPPSLNSFSARVSSYRDVTRSCHIISAPSHSAARTRKDIRVDDPDEIRISYLIEGTRRIRMSENDFLAGPGQMFVTSSYVPFRFVETNRTYKALQLIYPRNAFADTSRDELLLDPSLLNADPLCCILRALCLAIGRGIQSRPESELKTLLDVARDLLPLIAGHKRIDAIDTMRHTPFDIIALEIDMSLPDSGFTLDHLSRRLGVSSRYIQRLFARRGTTFRDLLRQKRMERAQRQLAENKRSIQQIAADCGYSELSAFYRAFKRRFGCNPGEMRQMALGHITQNLQM